MSVWHSVAANVARNVWQRKCFLRSHSCYSSCRVQWGLSPKTAPKGHQAILVLDGRAPASVAHGEVWALGKAQKRERKRSRAWLQKAPRHSKTNTFFGTQKALWRGQCHLMQAKPIPAKAQRSHTAFCNTVFSDLDIMLTFFYSWVRLESSHS